MKFTASASRTSSAARSVGRGTKNRLPSSIERIRVTFESIRFIL